MWLDHQTKASVTFMLLLGMHVAGMQISQTKFISLADNGMQIQRSYMLKCDIVFGVIDYLVTKWLENYEISVNNLAISSWIFLFLFLWIQFCHLFMNLAALMNNQESSQESVDNKCA